MANLLRGFSKRLMEKFSSKRTRKLNRLARQIKFESLEDRITMASDVEVNFQRGQYQIHEASAPVSYPVLEGGFAFYANDNNTRDPSETITTTVNFTISGTAVLGMDYTLVIDPGMTVPIMTINGNSGTIEFVNGDTEFVSYAGFYVYTIDDFKFEGDEDIVVTIDSVTTNADDSHGTGYPTASLSTTIIDGASQNPFAEKTDSRTTCAECEASANSNASNSGGAANPKSTTAGGVSAINGSVRAIADYDSSNGYGADLGVSLAWSNSPATLSDTFGSGIANAYQPKLAADINSDDILISFGAQKAFFYKDGSDYLPYHSDSSSLSYDSGEHLFNYIDTTGTRFKFYDDALDTISLTGFPPQAAERLRGQIHSITDVLGNTTSYVYDINVGTPAGSTGQLLAINRDDGLTDETWDYTYVTSGVNTGLVSEIVHSVDSVAVRTMKFAYYENALDSATVDRTLKSVVVHDGDSMADIIDRSYYRYYGAGESYGYTGGLKYFLRDQAIERVLEAESTTFDDLDLVADEDLADYADLHYEYDYEKRVTKLTALGEGCTICSASGEGSYQYSYYVGGNADGYNSWKKITTETLPDSSTRTYYLNFAGQKMLDVFYDGTNEWATYYRYDEQGRLILQANPSAVTGYSAYYYADLLHEDSGNWQYLEDSAGLITTYSYGTSTTATATTAGSVAGYLAAVSIQQGEAGTSVPHAAIQYYAHESEVDGTFVYPVATETVYRNENGTDSQTTAYAYTWRESSGETNQILSTTITWAFVSSAQNGSNTTESSITVNDEFGRPAWIKDAAGFISYIEYNNETGAAVKLIRDVDTNETNDFTNKPSGWATPSGGGLHLITTNEIDSLGRTIKMVDPKGNITYTVYNDAANEVRTYRGWDATNKRPTGPVEFSRSELIGAYTHDSNTYYGTYTEYLTYSVFGSLEVDGSGRPIGDENINGSDSGLGFVYTTTLQTLSRSLSNAGGQLIMRDQYTDFTGTTYTTSTYELSGADDDNFNRTEYVYNQRGLQSRVLDAEGMVTRTVYDKLGRVVSTWVGTDDTSSDPYQLWSPANNGGDMVQLNENEYDNGGVGDGNLTKSTQIPGKAWGSMDVALENRVTEFYYDWRNRVVAVKSGVSDDPMTEDTDLNRTISYTQYNNLNQAIAQFVYDGDGEEILSTDGVPDQPSSSLLRAKSTADYDDQGRVYLTTQYEVDQTSGTIGGTAIVNETFHDIRGLTSKIRNARGNVTTFDYNGLGRRVSVTSEDPDGVGVLDSVVTYTVYDANGNVEWTILNPTDTDYADLEDNAFGTHYTYDALDRRVTIEQPDPDNFVPFGGSDGADSRPETSFTYDAAGWLYEVTDPLNRVTRTEYDRLGRTIKTTLPDRDYGTITGNSPIYRTGYDGVGNVVTTTDPFNQTTTYGYNALHQKVSTTQPYSWSSFTSSSPVSYAKYTTGGDLLTTTDQMGRVTTYEYDLLGRQFQVTSPDPDGVGSDVAARMTYSFDVLGGVLTTTDRLSHQTESTYDGFHRLETSTNANGEETGFTYDANGNRLTLTDPNGNTTEWEYDALDRVIAETNELNKTRTFDYDQHGRMLVRTDRLGREIEYVYDNLNRTLAEKWDGDIEYEWEYDAAGQLLTVDAADPLVTKYQYLYNGYGQLLQRRYSYEPTGYQIAINYISDLDGKVIEYTIFRTDNAWTTNIIVGNAFITYDNLRRMNSMKHSDNSYRYQLANFAYNEAGQLIVIDRHDTYAIYSNPSLATRLVWTDYTYDGAGRLESLTHKDPDNNPFASYGYTWDASDRITAIDFLDGTYDDEDVTYTNDDAGQVIGADRSGSGVLQDENYDYDDNGNREEVTRDGVNETWGATANNQLSTDGVYNYHYDDEGNMSSRVKLDVYGAETDERREFSWDHRNRLAYVADYNASNVLIQTVAFSYNHENTLTFRIVTNGVVTTSNTRYEFVGNELWTDYGEIQGAYAYGHNIIYGPGTNMALFDVTGAGNTGGTGVFILLGDHQNTVRDMVHRNATTDDVELINHIQYDSFGNIKDQSYSGADLLMVVGYTGSYYERYTGLIGNWNRWYDPNAGRWISEDPIGFAGGDVNLGRYVGNVVSTGIDSSGYFNESGHFYSVYIAAIAAGKPESEAYTLAYYAQYPDQVDLLDALANSYGPKGPIVKEAWGQAIKKYLHSLHGGNEALVLAWRKCLEKGLTSGWFSDKEKGLLLHAYGDSFAHSWIDKNGKWHGYQTKQGHLFTTRGGHSPDIIAMHPQNHETYASNMFSIFGGKNRSDLDAYFKFINTDLVPAAGVIDRQNELKGSANYDVQWGEDLMAREFSMVDTFARNKIGGISIPYSRIYTPTPNALDSNMETVLRKEIINLFNKLKDECKECDLGRGFWWPLERVIDFDAYLKDQFPQEPTK
jgi:RHS repeat-associated protein